jgi:hypothetical protein
MITTQRFQQIFTLALQAKRSLDKWGSTKRNNLPKITVLEHDELVKQHPRMAAFTRCFEYGDKDYIEDTNRMSSSRLPKITEIWVGARSLGCIPGESAETESEGLSASQLDQENAAELTDLHTMLYHSPGQFNTWLEQAITDRVVELGKHPKNHIWRSVARRHILMSVPKDETGQPTMAMIETEDGPRPVRNGDMIQTVHGSNENLDALFLEEGDDPRMQNDHGAEGSDHKWSGRFRANTELEERFLHNRSYKLPNSATPEGVRWQPNEFTIRRSAAKLVETIIERRPEWADNVLALTDEAERRITAMAKDLAFDNEGQMTQGHFISRDEFFGTIEANAREYDAAIKNPKAAPSAVDWCPVRDAHQRVLAADQRQFEYSLQ